MASRRHTSDHQERDLGKIYHLTPTEELLFPCLFIQAQDAAAPAPILGDSYAQQYINKIGCDFSKNVFTTEPAMVRTFASRFKLHDQWLQRFLDIHEAAGQPATVLSLRCGLDSRCMRVRWGSSVRWIDVDSAEVVNLRKKLIPTPPGDYNLMKADFAGEDWLTNIPADRPTYIVAEELLMWLKPADGKRLIQRLVDHFPEGQLGTDVVGSVIKELSFLLPILKGANVRFHWAVNDGRKIEQLHRRLRIRQTVRWYELLGAASERDFEKRSRNRLRRRDFDDAASLMTESSYPHSTSTRSGAASSTVGGSSTSQSSGSGAPAPTFFGRWTSLFSHIPGFKNCAQVVLFDFGFLPRSRDSMHSTLTTSSRLTASSSFTGISQTWSNFSGWKGPGGSSKGHDWRNFGSSITESRATSRSGAEDTSSMRFGQRGRHQYDNTLTVPSLRGVSRDGPAAASETQQRGERFTNHSGTGLDSVDPSATAGRRRDNTPQGERHREGY
ncbi:S-adenosyl-L-methionine-dependent methyltransferase [Xylariomycetidae sp. FL2044]|nr:S-adenosyl-L-methionine-dependent methyltransferase [Xylariomycetidae sp. FL2044]